MNIFRRISDFAHNQTALFWTFLGMLILPNVMMFFTESTGVLTRIVNIVLPLGCYWFAMTFNRKPGVMFWWLFFFIFIDAFEIVLLYLFGESPIAVDMFLNVFTSNVTEETELLANLIPAVAFVFVIYLSGIVLAIVSVRNRDKLRELFRYNQRKVAIIVVVLGVILLGVNYAVDRKFRIQDDIFPVNGTYNFALSFGRVYHIANYERTSAGFTHHARTTRGDSIPEIYVLVIGETARADNFGIYGYERNTTPRMKALADSGELVVYHDALTMSNTTHKSVPMLLSAIASERYDSLYVQRGLISAFNEAGYNTAFYSNQRRNRSFIDFLGCEAQDVVFIKDTASITTTNVPDLKLLDLLDNTLRRYDGGKLLVVLHAYGSHFNYYDRYSRQQAHFTPDEIPSAEVKYREQLINAYDNTIGVVDELVNGIAERLRALDVPAVMIYTSDHGEDIFDDKRGRFLHASPIPTYYQLRVPYVVWASPAYRETFAAQWQAVMSHRDKPISPNMVTFHTLLDMSGIKATLFKPSLALSNPSFKPVPRLYVDDHNHYRTMDNCGLKKLDVEAFKNNHIQYP